MFGTRRRQSRILNVKVLALGLVVLAASACGENEIVHQLDEREANTILVVLDSKDISARKEKEEGRVITYKIVVSSKYASAARRILVDFDLPKSKSNRLADVFAESGMIPTQSEEKAKMLVGIQGEVEEKIRLIPGVLDVHAQVVIPAKDAVHDIKEDKPRPMASVVIVYQPIDGKIPYVAEDVKKAVAASVESMRADDVTILSYPNKPMSEMIAEAENLAAVGAGKASDGQAHSVGRLGPPTKKFVGVQIVDTRVNRTKFMTLLSVMGGMALFLLILAVVFLLGRIGLKKQLRKALAENTSYKKARGGE